MKKSVEKTPKQTIREYMLDRFPKEYKLILAETRKESLAYFKHCKDESVLTVAIPFFPPVSVDSIPLLAYVTFGKDGSEVLPKKKKGLK